MYFWKCWRDTRSRFIICLITVSLMCVTITAMLAKQGNAVNSVTGRQVGAGAMQAALSLVMIMAALTLGVQPMGQEFKEQTLGFLLTRPRRRRYWVWRCWSVGVGEILGVVTLGMVGSFAGLSYLVGHVYPWRWFATSLFLVVGAVAVYSLTYFLTVLSRSGELGVTGAVIFFIIDSMLLPVAFVYWHVHTSFLFSVLGMMTAGGEWSTSHRMTFPLGNLVAWAFIALVFPLAAQLLMDRVEV